MIVTPRNALAGMAALLLAGGTAIAGGMPPEIEIDANGVPIESEKTAAAAEVFDDGLALPPGEITAVAATPLEDIAAEAAASEVAVGPEEAVLPVAPVTGPFAMKKDHR
ncbi:MAG: hypothetical protein ACE5LF_02410 [Alphaproteobacteria bacterium]